MIKDKSEMPNQSLEIDLTGPKGNAFYLLGLAKDLSKQIGNTEFETNRILEQMKSGDYDHLIEVFDGNFGRFVTLYR